MTQGRRAASDGLARRSLLGALAGAAGVVAVMPLFYPLGRVFDPTVGGDPSTGLPTELVLGLIGGILLSPVAGLVGSIAAILLNGRRVGPVVALVLVSSGSVLAVGLWAALNGGFADDEGSMKSVQWIATLGALAGLVAIICYAFAQKALAQQITVDDSDHPRTARSA